VNKTIVQNGFLEPNDEEVISFWWFVRGEKAVTSIKVVAINLTNLP